MHDLREPQYQQDCQWSNGFQKKQEYVFARLCLGPVCHLTDLLTLQTLPRLMDVPQRLYTRFERAAAPIAVSLFK